MNPCASNFRLSAAWDRTFLLFASSITHLPKSESCALSTLFASNKDTPQIVCMWLHSNKKCASKLQNRVQSLRFSFQDCGLFVELQSETSAEDRARREQGYTVRNGFACSLLGLLRSSLPIVLRDDERGVNPPGSPTVTPPRRVSLRAATIP